MNPLGKLSTFQIGLQSAHGTAVAPTVAFEMLSESFIPKTDYKESEANMGKRGANDRIIASKKVEGGAKVYIAPHNIGYLLKPFFGQEAVALLGGATAAYGHEFKFAGVSDSLVPITAHVDRVIADLGFQDVYINSLTVNLELGNYVTVDIDGVGQKETSGNSQALPTQITTPFTYLHGQFEIDGDGTVGGYIESATVKFENGLKTDRRAFTTTPEYFLEPIVGKASVVYSINAYYTTETEALRVSNYNADLPVAVKVVLQHDTEIEAGYPYRLLIESDDASITNFDATVKGPDEIMATVEITANETDSADLVVVTLEDGQATEYTA